MTSPQHFEGFALLLYWSPEGPCHSEHSCMSSVWGEFPLSCLRKSLPFQSLHSLFLELLFDIFYNFPFFPFLASPWHMEVPGPGDLSHICDLHHSCGNTMQVGDRTSNTTETESLTHCSTTGTPSIFLSSLYLLFHAFYFFVLLW